MAKTRELNNRETYESITGEMDFMLTNDYIFKVVMQECEQARRGLIGALLMIDPEMLTVEVTNPIEIGKSIAEKDFYLDVAVLVNNEKRVNLEMQVVKLEGWGERTMGYSFRTFLDSIEKGRDYKTAEAVHQICLVDHDLFTEHNRFYDTFTMKNKDSSLIYSDKFKISVVNLRRIDEATNEDKRYGLDRWCRLIKADTWEELKRQAKEDEYMEAATKKVYEALSDFHIREAAIRREEHYAMLDRMNATIAEQGETIANKDMTIAEQEEALVNKDITIAEQGETIAKQEKALSERDELIAELRQQIEKLKV